MCQRSRTGCYSDNIVTFLTCKAVNEWKWGESSCEIVSSRHAKLRSQNIKQSCCSFFLIQHQNLLVESYRLDLMPSVNSESLVVGFDANRSHLSLQENEGVSDRWMRKECGYFRPSDHQWTLPWCEICSHKKAYLNKKLNYLYFQFYCILGEVIMMGFLWLCVNISP